MTQSHATEARRLAILALIAAAITAGVLMAVYELGRADLRVPMDYDGSGLLHNLVAQRLSGGPDGPGGAMAAELDSLRLEGQPLNVGLLAALAWVSGDSIVAMNLFILLAFPLAAVTGTLAARGLGLSAAPAVSVGVLFAFLPIHLVFALERPFVGALWGVPLAAYLSVATLSGRVMGHRSPYGRRSLAFSLGLAVLVGLSGWLVGVVGAASVGLAAAIGAVGRGSRVLPSGIGVSLLMALTVALTMGSDLLHQPRDEDGRAPAPGPVEVVSDARAGVADLILPIEGHRLGRFDAARQAYTAENPGSDASAALGVVGVTGLLVLIASLATAVGTGRSGASARLALLVVGLLMVFGADGLLRLVGPIVPALDRWTPVAAFIGFFALLAAGFVATRLLAWSRARTRPWRLGVAAGLASIAAAGLLDQTSPIHAPAYNVVREAWMRDAAVADNIAAALPGRARVYQMSDAIDPSGPNLLPADAQARMALHQRDLSWNSDLVRGTSAPWELVMESTPARLVPAVLASLGFDGLLVHRAAAAGAPAEPEATFANVLADDAVDVEDERVALFDLRSYRSQLEGSVGADSLRRLADSAMRGGPLEARDFEPRLEPLARGFVQPVGVEEIPDGTGRLAVLERRGLIWLVSTSGEVSREPFLDIQALVSTEGWEQGLLGLAFHPDFGRNGRLFVHYTARNNDVVVVELQARSGADRVDPESARDLLRVPKPSQLHNGGQLAFGPDGQLYAGIGDGVADFPESGPPGTGQDRSVLLGSIIRIDVDSAGVEAYAIPQDNPFVGEAGRPEIWVNGLRNPWRFSFDSQSGDLYIGDVGQLGVEEVNVQRAGSGGGENFGWRVMAGSACFESACDPSPFALPRYEYARADGRCALTGGYVYRGEASPLMNGHYVYGDLCTGQIWSIATLAEPAVAIERLDTQLTLSSFGQRVNGELLVVDYSGGSLYELDLGP